MAMSYTSLTAAKGTSGAIATWVAYTLLDVVTIVDEAQTLLYSMLRAREMLTDMRFSMGVGDAHLDLPARFLDPVGDIMLTSFNVPVRHMDGNAIQRARSYTELSGTLDTDPFTTVSGSTSVTVALEAHGFSQDSVFNTEGATAVGGVTINGTFPIISIEEDTFVIDIASLGSTPTSSATGGGAAVDYLCDNLTQGIPVAWGIWNEKIYFDVAFSQQSLGTLQYYQSLALLSSTNLTNFLTNRYPQLVRTACMASAADFMKDDAEYQKGVARLGALIERTAVDNDGFMRGMDLSPIIP